MIDNFANMNDKETEKRLDEWWSDLEYLDRLRILLRIYTKLNITKIEMQGINALWRKIPIDQQKDIFSDQWKFSGR